VPGGIIGALTQSGISEDEAHVYAEGVRRGGTLVTARINEADRSRYEAILNRSAVDHRQRGAAYRQSGWSKFDPSAQPYTADQVRSERARYASPQLLGGARRTITAFFEDRKDASEAVQRLEKSGIPRSEIRMVEGAKPTTSKSSPSKESGGFWDSLSDFFLPDDDRETYAEGLRRGGYLVSVGCDEAHYDRALEILDDEGTIDIDQRAAAWRKEGWSPGARTRASSTSQGRSATGSDQVIPVTEEQLKVGKRDVSHGRVRVRSYIVETPVQEDVNLREEHVRVERRAVDRPASGDEKLFRERTIEAEERAEEAVVEKVARVKEELVVKKGVEQRTETVSDKVRRTEVKVEDDRNKDRPSERTRR
jgi:uncharacterized protein (TIGR02271 family)